jgi:DNA primase
MIQRSTSFQTKSSFDSDRLYKLKNELLFLKESVDVGFLLASLGFVVKKETSSELRASCIIHGGDNETSFRFNKKTRTWSCFSHACNELYGKDIIALIRACKGFTFAESVSFLKELTGYTGGVESEKIIEYKRKKDKMDFIKEFGESSTKVVRSKYLDEHVLEVNKFLRTNYFIDEGFTKETLDYFDVSGGYIDEKGIKRDVIPIRDADGILAGCSFSSTVREVLYKDKYLITPNLDKDNILYNLNNALPYLEKKPLILVEGFKSVWRLYDYGIYNVAACMGAALTPGQKNLLLTHSPNGAIIFFDNDGPGIEGAVRANIELTRKLKTQVIFITEIDSNGKGLDPADLTKDVVYTYLNDYI